MPAEDLPPASADDGPGWELPESYATTALFRELEVCERFGLNPENGLDRMEPGRKAVLLAYSMIRRAEEARAMAAGAGLRM